MSEMRRRMMMAMMSGSTSLPFDSFVQWLEAPSVQSYIDTEVSGQSGLEFGITFEFFTPAQYSPIFGNYIDEAHNCCRVILANTLGNQFYCNNNTKAGSPLSFDATADSRMQLYIGSTFTNYSKGRGYTSIPTSEGTENQSHIALFQRSVSTLSSFCATVRCYLFWIRKNGEYLRYMMPVRVGTTGFMYDGVSGRLFGSIGTDDFNIGADVPLIHL